MYLSIFVELLSKSRSVKAFLAALLMDKDGEPSLTAAKRTGVHVLQTDNCIFGWTQFVKQTDLAKDYVKDGQIKFVWTIVVLHDNSIPVPPSDIGKNLGMLLDSTDGVDVSFTMDGETFHAHRAVLAARSPVFKAELLGSMAEATMPSITLHDIAPATFKAMLWFMYTDALPGDDELGDSPTKMFEHLLVAADRYALNRLKLISAQKLWDNVSVDTIADALACAEMYNCPELKNKCIGFVVAEKNFKKVVLTDGFMQLGQKFPSIVAEVRERVGA
uniref:BTB domain-containing protein n=1 Tax=Arundo donax TaxID=35708 RepID=A0A0A9ASZ8_ARUDO